MAIRLERQPYARASWVLLEALKKRYESIIKGQTQIDPRVANMAFGYRESVQGKVRVDFDSRVGEQLNKEQVDAVQASLGSEVTYIWGPPGTGKTKVIGRIATQFLESRLRVLIVSHTNIAVDHALSNLVQEDEGFGFI